MDRRMKNEIKKISAEANRIEGILFNTLTGTKRDEMSEAVSEEMERIFAEEHPVVRAEYRLMNLRSIASDFGVKI